METGIKTSGRHHYRTALIGFVLGAVVATLAGDVLRSAYAQIPNAGRQRQETNTGLEQLNASVGEVLAVLRTGTLKVRIVETDKSSGAGTRTGTAGTSATSGTTPRTVAPARSPTEGTRRRSEK